MFHKQELKNYFAYQIVFKSFSYMNLGKSQPLVNYQPWDYLELVKVALIEKIMMWLSYPQTDKPNYFPELEIMRLKHFKGLKSCHVRTWSYFEGSNRKMDTYLSLQSSFRAFWDMIWALLKWHNFEIQVQGNDLVPQFGYVTNGSVLSK